jgi:predicted ester cyclase
MSTDENKAIVRLYFGAMERADIEVLVSFWASDALNYGRGRTVPPEQRGLDLLRAVFRSLRTAFPDRKWHIEDMIAEGDKVVCRLTLSGTHQGMTEVPIEGGFLTALPPTGKPYSVTHIHIVRLVDGKITEHWAARDDLGLLQQLGVIPVPGQATH